MSSLLRVCAARGTWVEKPDLSKVDEIGWTQLIPGSGHGVGGFVSVSKFEVWGKPVPRTVKRPSGGRD